MKLQKITAGDLLPQSLDISSLRWNGYSYTQKEPASSCQLPFLLQTTVNKLLKMLQAAFQLADSVINETTIYRILLI